MLVSSESKNIRLRAANCIQIKPIILVGLNAPSPKIEFFTRSRINTANRLWASKCGIRIQVAAFVNYACEKECIIKLITNTNQDMRKIMEAEFLTNQRQYLKRPVVTIFIAPEATFIDKPNVIGYTYTYGTPDSFGIYIWLTMQGIDGDNTYALAHEIGHALLIESFNKNRIPPHSSIPTNLMHPIVPKVNPGISEVQCRVARQSFLLFT